MTIFGIIIIIIGIGVIGIGWFIMDDKENNYKQEIQERLERYCK